MSIDTKAYSVYRIGSPQRERLEDHARDMRLTTPGGLDLQIALVCDGVGSADWGVIASKKATDVIFEHIENSAETDVPTLLTEAVSAANRVMLETIPNRQGNTTVALLAVHLNDDSAPHGRLFIASVGDSFIYIARSFDSKTKKKLDKPVLERLNRDHNVETDLRRGEMTPEQAGDSALSDITRALGLRKNLKVDIGFYRGDGPSQITPAEKAEERGRKGLKLEEGDTVFACSDGVRDPHPDGEPFLTDEKIFQHTLDVDAELAAKTLVAYAEARETNDNVSISLIFIPSKLRKGNYVERGVPRGLLIGGVAVLVAVIAIALVAIGGAGSQVSSVQQTSTAQAIAQAQTQGALDAEGTNVRATEIFELSATPTPTATFTPSLTPSATPTSTPRPVFAGVADQAGFISVANEPQPRPLTAAGDVFIAPNVAQWTIDGGEARSDTALVYLRPGAQFTFADVNNGTGRLQFELPRGGIEGSGIFALQQGYTRADIRLNDDPDDLVFTVEAACWAIDMVGARKLALTCLANPEGRACRVGTNASIPAGQQMTWDMNVAEASLRAAVSPIDPALLAQHYDAVTAMDRNPAALGCIVPLIDGDSDGVIDRDDLCPAEAGDPNAPVPGCPPTPTPTNTPWPSPTATASPLPLGVTGTSVGLNGTSTAVALGLTNAAATDRADASNRDVQLTQTAAFQQTAAAQAQQTAAAQAQQTAAAAVQQTNAAAVQQTNAAAVQQTNAAAVQQTNAAAAQQTAAAAVEQTAAAAVQQTNAAAVQQTNAAAVQQTEAAAVQQTNAAAVQQTNAAAAQQTEAAAVQQTNAAAVQQTEAAAIAQTEAAAAAQTANAPCNGEDGRPQCSCAADNPNRGSLPYCPPLLGGPPLAGAYSPARLTDRVTIVDAQTMLFSLAARR